MLKVLPLIFFLIPVCAKAQFTYVLDQAVVVKDDEGNSLPFPWAGGLNAAHYNTMDLNHDGKDDLVLFDRAADKISTFINADNQYRYAPEYETFFPDEITNWLLLRDYNCDGRKDIFTGSLFGISVFTNVATNGAPPAWERFIFFSGEGKSEALLTTGLSGKINLQLQFDDLPSIIDADGDGDLDIFNLRFAGEGSIEYHRNYSVERQGTCDSLDFEKVTQKWAGLAECHCGEFAFNNDDCAPHGGRTQHAAGKSLLMIDLNNDNALDILFSEADCTNLYALMNEGTTENPVINSFNVFPTSQPVSFLIFPAAFYEDVDFDGRKDLISTPNIFSKTPETINADLTRSNWVYKNTGTNAAPVFTFSTNSFLQDRMIDVGDNAVPALIDYDFDGDLDMFVSHNNVSNSVATVRLYENTGTPSSPEFTLVNADAFGFSNTSFYNLKIQFADLNHDAKTDLVFTATDFLNGQTRLYYIPNKSSSAIDFEGQSIQPTDVQIVSSENVLVVDVDADGYQDLLVGKSNGSFQYLRRQQQAVVAFTLEDETFLGFGADIFRQNLTGAATDLDGDGKTDLILGDQSGLLKLVSNFRAAGDNPQVHSDVVFNPLTSQYISRNLGGRIWPTAGNLFGTDRPAIVVGNAPGGLHILRNDEGTSLPKDPDVVVYRNPSKVDDFIYVEIDRPATMFVFTSLGQEVAPPVSIPANERFSFKLPSASAGVYVLRFHTGRGLIAKRLVLVD
jgi:hypothetical protein